MITHGICDGSYTHGSASWGAVTWPGSDYVEDSWSAAGLCPPKIQTSTLAEFYAILMSARIMRRRWPESTELRIYTDCDGVVPWCTQTLVDAPARVIHGNRETQATARDLRRQLLEDTGDIRLVVECRPRDEVIEAHRLAQSRLRRHVETTLRVLRGGGCA